MPRPFFLSETEIYAEKKEAEEAAKKGTRRTSKGKSTSTPKEYTCEECGLLRRCRSPNMERYGKGKKDILIIGEYPGSDEDKMGKPFAGVGGKYLTKVLKANGIDIKKDCVSTNVIRCRPPSGRPKDRCVKAIEKKCCLQKLVKDIEEVKPKLIICLGESAVRAVMKHKVIGALGTSIMPKVHSTVFPYHKYNTWVGCSYHPDEVVYRDNYKGVFAEDIGKILEFLDKPLSQPLTNEGSILVDDSRDVEDLLTAFIAEGKPVAFDYEATCLSAIADGAKLLTVSLANTVEEGWCIWLNNPDWNVVEQAFVYHKFKEFLKSDVPKIVQNLNMEELWGREHIGASINNLVMDTMVASHVVNCKRGTTGLDYQVFRMTGDYYSDMVNKKKMADEPIEMVAPYNNKDSRYTLMLFQELREILDRKGNEDLSRFYKFLHDCLFDLCDLKERGLPVDLDELVRFKEKAIAQNIQYQKDLVETEAGKKFKAVYEEDLNIESPKQLCDLFYEIYEEKCYKKTASGGKSIDAVCLQKLNQLSRSRDVKEATDIILDYKKTISFLKKLTEYEGVTGPDGRLHPSYTVNVAETYRSSTWDPNVQNMFKRDPELVKFRKIIIPSRPENYLLEVDVDGIEFRTWGMVSGAKELAHQISEFDKFRVLHPGKPNPWDPHSRWGTKLFEKPLEDITKDERFESKNSFVFATIYGSQPKPIAANMGMEVEHIEAVWNAFWEEYWEAKEWREKILADYKKNNYVSAVTGFRRPGPLSNEQIYNTPVQGPAFHLILDSISRVNKVLAKEGFKTQLISEIHDSKIFDAWPDEIEDVIEITTDIICSKRFDWQRDMPLSVTWEIGKNFYSMEEI